MSRIQRRFSTPKARRARRKPPRIKLWPIARSTRVLSSLCVFGVHGGKEDFLPRRREEREENPENKSLAHCRLASSMYSPRVRGGKKEFDALKMKNDAPAPIGASIDARGNASRWAQNFAGTRLATSFQRLGARGNGALALRKSAISRQFDRLAHTNATWEQRFTGGGRNHSENSNLYLKYKFI
jgi:hypothetical protein